MQEQQEGAPHLNGNFLKDGVQCLGFRYPKGRLHDFAMPSVRVTFTAPRSMSHHKPEEISSYLPWSELHHQLSNRQAPVKQAEHHDDTVTYIPSVQILGGLQAWDVCSRKYAGCDV